MNNEKIIKLPKQVEELSVQMDNIVQVKITDFGADKTGIKNCSDIIKQAIDSNSSFIHVHFPAGTFVIDKNIVIDRQNVMLTGEGKATTLFVKSGVTAFEVAKNNGVYNLVIENMRFYGDTGAVGAISLGGTVANGGSFSAFTVIKNCTIKNFNTINSFGVKLERVQELDIENCYIADNYNNIIFQNVDGNYCTSTTVRGKAGYIGRAINIGILLEKAVCSFVVSDIVVEANMQGGIVAIGGGTEVAIKNVHFEENKGANTVYVSGTDVAKAKFSMNNNFFFGNSKPILRTDFVVDSVVKNNVGLIDVGNIITTPNTTIHFELNKSQDVVNNQKAIELYKTLEGNITYLETNLDQTLEMSLDVINLKNNYRVGKLSYYEEKSFTPTILCTDGSINTSVANAKYTRIGNLVTISCELVVSEVFGSMTGDIKIGNLPFYVRSKSPVSIFYYNMNLQNANVVGMTQITSKEIVLNKSENGNTFPLAPSLKTGSCIILSVTYMTD